MTISNENEKIIKDSLAALNLFLDAPAYRELIDNKNISAQTQSTLTACWDQRDKLVNALLKIYAADIKENNPKFQDLIAQMKDVKVKAQAASQGLTKITDKINSAVSLAKSADGALDIAAILVH